MNLETHLAEYKKDGFTVFEKVFNPELMDQWKAKFDDIAERQKKPGEEKAPKWLRSVTEYEPALMLKAVANPMILDFAEMVMGPFVQLDNLTFAWFESMSKQEAEGKVSGWHRDIWAWTPNGSDYIRPNACNAITYLQDLTDAYGPLRVIRGSHRDPMLITPEEKLKPHPREELVHVKAGDVAFTHCALYHSGTPNTSGDRRWFFSIYYNLSWLKHRDNHSGPNVQAIIEEARNKNDRRIMRIFGVDDRVFGRANSGYHVSDEKMWKQWIAEDEDFGNQGEL